MKTLKILLLFILLILPFLSVFSSVSLDNRTQTSLVNHTLAAALTSSINHTYTVDSFDDGTFTNTTALANPPPTYSESLIPISSPGNCTDSKPFMLNGNRYIAATVNCTYIPFAYDYAPISIFTAYSNWSANTLLSTSVGYGCSTDFYLSTFENVLPDLVILTGNFEDGCSNGIGFIASFNVSSHVWTWMNTTMPHWITDVEYCACNNSFYIIPVDASTFTYLYTAALANLFNIAHCVQFPLLSCPMVHSNNKGENRICYGDGCLFVARHQAPSCFDNRFDKYNFTSKTWTIVMNHSEYVTEWLGEYCESNGTAICYCQNIKASGSHVYYSLDGITFIELTVIPITGYDNNKYEQGCCPINDNLFYIVDAGYRAPDSFHAIYNMNGTCLYKHYNTAYGITTPHPFRDGTSYILGVEDSYAEIQCGVWIMSVISGRPGVALNITTTTTTSNLLNYPANDAFTQDTNGAGPQNWAVVEPNPTFCYVIQSKEYHNKVVDINDADASSKNPSITKGFTGQTTGTVEFWLQSNSTANYIQIMIRSGSTNNVYTQFFTNSSLLTWKYHYSSAWIPICDISKDLWYHFRISFNYTAHTFSAWVNNASAGVNLPFDSTSGASATDFQLGSYTTTTAQHIYFDAWDVSWDGGYYQGRNWHYTNASTSVIAYNVAGNYLSSVIDLGSAINYAYTALTLYFINNGNSHIDFYLRNAPNGTGFGAWGIPLNVNQTLNQNGNRYIQFKVSFTASSDNRTSIFHGFTLDWQEITVNQVPYVAYVQPVNNTPNLGLFGIVNIQCGIYDADNDLLSVSFYINGTLLDYLVNWNATLNANLFYFAFNTVVNDSVYCFYWTLNDSEDLVNSGYYYFSTVSTPPPPLPPPPPPLNIVPAILGIFVALIILAICGKSKIKK